MGQPLFVFTVSMAHSKDRHNPLCILRNTLEISIVWATTHPPYMYKYRCICWYIDDNSHRTNEQWSMGIISVQLYWHDQESNFLNCRRSNRSVYISFFFFFSLSSSLFSFHLCYFKEKTYWFSVFVEIILEMGFSSRILIRFRGL